MLTIKFLKTRSCCSSFLYKLCLMSADCMCIYIYIFSLVSLLWKVILSREYTSNSGHVQVTILLCNCSCFTSVSLPVFIKMLFKSHFLRDNWICYPWLSTSHPICYSSHYRCSKIPQTG